MKRIYVIIFITLNLLMLSACGGSSETLDEGKKMQVPPISVQLWSVKHTLEADFEGTLKQIAEMGFSGVEFAGFYGQYAEDPQGLKAFLASIGLQPSGAHVGINHLRGDELTKTLTFLKALGVDLVIIPADSRAWEADGIKSLAAEVTELSKTLAKMDMTIGYHNHDKEFDDYNNSTFWDYLAQNTPDNVLLQLDVGWVNYAGKDPIEYVKRYQGRTLTTHYKVRTHEGSDKSPIIGEDGYDWASLIKVNAEFGGTLWLVVEQEEYPEGLTPMQSVAKSKQGLDKFIQQL